MNKFKLTATKIECLLGTCQELKFPEFLKACRQAYGLTRREVCKDLKFSEMRMFWLESGYFKRDIPTQDLSRLAEYYCVPVEKMIGKYQVFQDLCQGQAQTHYSPKKKRKKSENSN